MRDFLTSFGYERWILPALLLIPFVGAALVLLLGRGRRGLPPGQPTSEPEVAREAAGGDVFEVGPARSIALFTLLVELVVSLGLWFTYQPQTAGWHASVDLPWIPDWGVGFTLGIDGIALMMILLTTFTMPLAVLGSWTGIRTKPRAYYALLLVLTSGLLGEQYIGIEAGAGDKNLAAGDTITTTQSAVVLENLIGQFLYNKAADGPASGSTPSKK